MERSAPVMKESGSDERKVKEQESEAVLDGVRFGISRKVGFFFFLL